MNQKIIADLGIAKSIISFLQSHGFEVIRIVHLKPSMTDKDILSLALEINAILLQLTRILEI